MAEKKPGAKGQFRGSKHPYAAHVGHEWNHAQHGDNTFIRPAAYAPAGDAPALCEVKFRIGGVSGGFPYFLPVHFSDKGGKFGSVPVAGKFNIHDTSQSSTVLGQFPHPFCAGDAAGKVT